MKRFIIGTLILITVLVVAAVTIPFFVPKEVYKAQIQAATSKALDREVLLEGDVSLSVFPQISVGVDGLTIANAEGFEGDYLIKAGELRAAVKVLPLLSRRVEVSTLSFVDADVNLIRNADGAVNWELGSAEETESPNDQGGGTSDSIQAGIDRARLVNASLSFVDNVEETSYRLEQVNATASMKGLDLPLDASIDGVFEGREFQGRAYIEAPNALLADETSDVDVSFAIAAVQLGYKGSVKLGEVPLFTGSVELAADKLDEITELLQMEVQGAELIGKVELSADVSGTADDLSLSSIKASHQDGAFTANYNGYATVKGEDIGFDGTFDMKTNQIDAITSALALEIDGSELLETVEAEGTLSGALSGSDLKVDFESLKASHSGAAFKGDYDGKLGLVGETVTLDGRLNFNSSNVQQIADRMKLEIDGIELVDAVDLGANVKGSASADTTNLTLSDINTTHKGQAFNASYRGGATLKGEAVSLNGAFDFDTNDLEVLTAAVNIPIDGIEAVKRVNVSGNVTGTPDALGLTGVSLTQSSDLLKSSFNGNISTVGAGSVAGQLSASSDKLRALMSAAKIEMTPGETLQSFDIGGTASGTLEQLKLTLNRAKLDDMSATGDILVDTRGARMLAKVNARTDRLDLTPFTKPDPNAPVPEGWSKVPLPFESLSLIDADFDLAVDRLVIDKITLSDATVTGTLRNGELKARMPDFKSFGGRWAGVFNLDASGQTPRIDMNFEGNSIAVENLVKTFTGIDRIAGQGLFKIDAEMSGTSLYDLANSLNGGMNVNMGEGVIRGFNASQFIRSREDILSSLTSGRFNLPIGPSAETDFTKLNSVLSIRNGVGNFDALEMLNPFVSIEGLGKVNFGQQSIDINLKFFGDPTGQGQNSRVLGVGGVGIPINIKGNWLSPSIGADTTALRSLVTSTVIERVAPNLGDVVGGDADQLIRGILGGGQVPTPTQPQQGNQQPAQGQPATQTPTTTPPKEEPKKPETPEEVVEDIARQALGDIFGRRKPPEKKDEED